MTSSEQRLQAAQGYIQLGMFQDAWDELEALPPEFMADDMVSELRVSIYQALEKWEPARILAESLAKRSPENVGWWILWAYALRREKSVEDAKTVLMEAAAIHPNEALIPYNLACYSCVLGNLEASQKLLNMAFAMDPNLQRIALDDPDLDPLFGNSPPESPLPRSAH